ncbi:MAG: S1 family peptidase [Candidatus Binataceae bacterium]
MTLDCAIYLYDSERAARAGENAGASGFLVGMASTKHRGMWWIYAVTNSHVIKDGNSVVRLNKREAGRGYETEVVPTEKWIHHQKGDDIAICPIDVFGKRIKFQFLDVRNHFVVRNEMPLHNLGPGDDVYMVGRLLYRGIQRNLPVVHTGVIAMMPLEPLESTDGFLQESFIIECRSIGGFSGSPVFVRRRRDELPDVSFPKPGPPSDYRQWLLGINWCHLHEHLENVYTVNENNELEDTPYRVRANSGFAGVIPAWKLRDLIDGDIARAMREEDERAMTTKKAKSAITLDSGRRQPTLPRMQKSRAGKDIPIPTERDVADFFKKATRKRKP